MTAGLSMLERQLTDAFAELADALPQRALPLAGLHAPARRRPRRGARLLIAAACITALGVAVVAFKIVVETDSHSTTHSPSVAAAQPTEPTTNTQPAPIGVTGPEVPLRTASTNDSDNLVREILGRNPDAHPIAVAIPDHAPIVVYSDGLRRCMWIAGPPYSDAGGQGACIALDEATDRIVGTIDTGPVETPTSVTYGAWTNVPIGTSYVTFTYGDQAAWQRPIDGVSYFTIPGTRPPLGPEPAILRAFDSSGVELGQATATPYLDGSGNWRWR
jgi:hypothetical protein